jgi:hypothetical protein
VTGDDIDERLDALFPGADLLSISTVHEPLPDEGQEAVPEPVADFYTIAGDDATQGMSEELPEDIADVEFDALMNSRSRQKIRYQVHRGRIRIKSKKGALLQEMTIPMRATRFFLRSSCMKSVP